MSFAVHLYSISSLVFLCSLIVTWLLANNLIALNIIDSPNARSLHSTPVPRTGGIAILVAICCGLLWHVSLGGLSSITHTSAAVAYGWIIVGCMILASVSFIEDMWGVARTWRFICQIGAALLLVTADLVPDTLQIGPWIWPLPFYLAEIATVIGVVWMTNLYNFMDGMDGLAGSMAVVGFITMALIGWQHNSYEFTIANATIAAAVAGFLVWNLPPARLFMGDTGSIPLGYMVAAMALLGVKHAGLSLWAMAVLFSPFIVDATITLARRLWHGEKVLQPHRTHFYQRLVTIMGWSHNKTLMYEHVLMLLAALLALILQSMDAMTRMWLLASVAILYGILVWHVRIMLRRHKYIVTLCAS